MPLQATSGAASYDAFGGGVAAVPNYIEDVFSTWLITGTGSAQTITNGIDLAGKGGLVWSKRRDGISDHWWVDTARGAGNYIMSNATNASAYSANLVSAFNSNGFNAGVGLSGSGQTYASWTFRKQPKFFDIVTYTGNGNVNRTLSHSLNGDVGAIIVKLTDSTGDWYVLSRNNNTSSGVRFTKLNSTAAGSFDSSSHSVYWTNTTFQPALVDPTATNTNINGATYVAYLFAHNAGGFGLTGTDNVISCGSFTTNGSGNATVSLGYEPQYLMLKCTSAVSSWLVQDNMRGFSNGNYAELFPNSSSAEGAGTPSYIAPTATGFSTVGTTNILGASNTYIYIAIRRGPMKVPTSGTSVFSPALYTGTGSTNTITSPFPSDLLLVPNRAGQFYSPSFWDRLRGATKFLRSPGTDAEAVSSDGLTSFGAAQNSVAVGADATYGNINFSGRNYVPYFFRRAPSFFDEVCYTGTGVTSRSVVHNLGVVPELLIVKQRSGSGEGWVTLHPAISKQGNLTYPDALGSISPYYFGNGVDFSSGTYIAPTSTTFTLGSYAGVNASGATFVSYLFASCPGVSKVGSYTGTGTTLQINCGFTGGARFVLIKRTDSTGDWYVWDSARGIVAGNDPYLLLNSTAAEVTTTDYIDTYSAGFEISSTAPAAINASGGTYIYLAIA